MGQAEMKNLTSQGFRCILLKTSGAFHSPYMKAAEAEFAKAIKSTSFKSTSKCVYSSSSGKPYKNVSEELSHQMTSQVKFVDTIKNMYQSGARVFVEFGPRNSLSKMISKIAPDAYTVAINANNKEDSE